MTEKEIFKEKHLELASDSYTMELYLRYVQLDVLDDIREEKIKTGK